MVRLQLIVVKKKVNKFLEIRKTQSQIDRRETQQLALTKLLLIFEFPLANNQWLDANQSEKKISKIDFVKNNSINLLKYEKSISEKQTKAQPIA